MTDYTGKAQFFTAFKFPAEYEADADRFFEQHAKWVRRTHPKNGDTALLQYTVAKRHDDEGNVLLLLAEVYETGAGVENHSRLWREDAANEPELSKFQALLDKCETIGGGSCEIVHSLW